MAEHTVAAPEVQQSPMAERTRHHERSVAPPVDIYETREGLVSWPMYQGWRKRRWRSALRIIC